MELITAPSKCKQVADFIEKEILSGKLRPGARLYSMRELCVKFNSTVTVIDSAYDTLEKKGLIRRYPRKGVFVAKKQFATEKKYGLITNVGVRTRPNYHEALFSILSKTGGSVMPVVLDSRVNWHKEVDRLVDDDPSVILVDLEAAFFELDDLREHLGNIPHLFINRWEWPDPLPEHGVFIDYARGYEIALQYLLRKGHKRILFVGYEPEPQQITEQYLKEVAKKCSIEYPGPQLDYIYGYSFAIDFDRTMEFIRNNPPTALISRSDEIMFSFSNMLQLFLPDIAKNVEMIGFHNIIYSKIPGYEFSTFAVNYDLFWQKVLDRFNPKKSTINGIDWITPEFIIREKTKINMQQQER